MDIDKVKEKRKLTNQDLIRRMRRGEPLNLIEPQATFFPPRPIIKKDKKAIEILYNIAGEKMHEETTDD